MRAVLGIGIVSCRCLGTPCHKLIRVRAGGPHFTPLPVRVFRSSIDRKRRRALTRQLFQEIETAACCSAEIRVGIVVVGVGCSSFEVAGSCVLWAWPEERDPAGSNS